MSQQRTEQCETNQVVAERPASRDDIRFRDLLAQVSDGSEDAAWDLVENYGDTILRAVRRALDSRMRQRFDSTDFVQLVWASFFKVRGRLDRFSTPAELAAFLIRMARNKVGMEARGCLVRQKRNMNRERSLNDSVSGVGGELRGAEAEPIDIAIAREEHKRFLQGQPERFREIIRLKLAGHTQREIASRLGIAECTVRRFLKKLCRDNDQ